jgi:putative membrane protein
MLTATASVGQSQSSDPTTSAGGTASTVPAAQDAEFLTRAAQAGRDEIEEAQTAMQSARREDVRNVASMMLEDHQRANQKLEDLARRKGWSLPAAVTAQRDQSRSGTAGDDFDSKYLTEEIRHHKEAISLYRRQAASGVDPDLQKFATDSLPKLEHHLDMLESASGQ